MVTAKTHFWLDSLLFISFLVIGVTGTILFFSLRTPILINTILTLHKWTGLILIILICIHLALHWTWIVCMIKNIFTKQR